MLHDIKRCADDCFVLTEAQNRRYRNRSFFEGSEDPELALHSVCGLQYLPMRLLAQHIPAAAKLGSMQMDFSANAELHHSDICRRTFTDNLGAECFTNCLGLQGAAKPSAEANH